MPARVSGSSPKSSGSPRAQRLAVERAGCLFLDLLDRAALDEQPLHRIKRRQRVVLRLQRADFRFDPEQAPDEILDMRCEIDEQV